MTKLISVCAAAAAVCLLVCTVTEASVLVPDTVFSNNGRLAEAPNFGRVGGIVQLTAGETVPNIKGVFVDIASTAPPEPLSLWQQLWNALFPPAKNRAKCGVTLVAESHLYEWVCVLPKAVAAGPTLYNVTMTGFDASEQPVDVKTITGITFNKAILTAGQSGFKFPFTTAVFFAPDPTLTNRAAQLADWAARGLLDLITIFSVTDGAANAVGSYTYKNTVSTVVPWTRYKFPDGSVNPGFLTALNLMGSQTVYDCIELADRHGAVHCAEGAVSTTRIQAHLPYDQVKTMGVPDRKPQTSVNTDIINEPGAIAQGVEYSFRNFDPDQLLFSQGEADFFDCQVLNHFQRKYQRLMKRRFNNNGRTLFTLIGLGNYGGFDVITNIAQNPTYAACQQAQFAFYSDVDFPENNELCFIPALDTDYFTTRPFDGGLHTPDTYPTLAQRAQDCADNKRFGGDNAVEGPIFDHVVIDAYDSVAGVMNLTLTFKTPNYPAASGLSGPAAVVYVNTIKAVNRTGDVFSIEQKTTPTALATGPRNLDATRVLVTNTDTNALQVSFAFDPALGKPSKFNYHYSPNPQVVIANDPRTTKAITGYLGRAGSPARYFPASLLL